MKARIGMIAVIASTTLGVAGAATAQAGPHWPAACKTFRCVNAHLNALHTQTLALQAIDKRQNKTINQLISFDNSVGSAFDCFAEYPVSVDPSTYLFVTAAGNTPAAWTLADSCDTSPATKTRAPFGGASPLARMLR
jgi:hypothetical protein